MYIGFKSTVLYILIYSFKKYIYYLLILDNIEV